MSTSLAVDLESLDLNNYVSRTSDYNGWVVFSRALLVAMVTVVVYDYGASRIHVH